MLLIVPTRLNEPGELVVEVSEQCDEHEAGDEVLGVHVDLAVGSEDEILLKV